MFTLSGTRLNYFCDGSAYSGEIKETPQYFTPAGYLEYIADNMQNLKISDKCAVYEMVNIPLKYQGPIPSLITEQEADRETEQKAKYKAVQTAFYDMVVKNIELERQNRQLMQKNAQLGELIPVLQFASHYPSWSTWDEFTQLPDYQYISIVRDDIARLKHNFHNTRNTFCLIDRACALLSPYIVPPFGTSNVMKNLIAAWEKSSQDYESRGSLFNTSVKNPPGELHDFISLYIIGVLAGWLYWNQEKILPYEYVIFIDVGQVITFRLVTMNKHAECPKRFMFDKHRFIINGVSRV